MRTPPPARACTSGFPHGLLVDFAMGDLPEDTRREVREHLETCGACALEFAGIQVAVGPPHARAGASGREAGAGRLFRLPDRRLLAGIAAAVLLIAVTLSATAGIRSLWRPVFVTSSPDPGWTLMEAEALTGIRFAETGLSGEGTLLSSVTYIAGPASVGRVALVRTKPGRKFDLCGFAADGSCAWVASRDWPAGAWAAAFDEEFLIFEPLAMKTLVTRRVGDRLEETVALTVHGPRRSAVFLVDPVKGELRGAHFHDGFLKTDNNAQSLCLGPLPAPRGAERALLVGGQHETEEGFRPCLTVFEPTGEGRAHLLLPTLPGELGLGDPIRNTVYDVRIDWEEGGSGFVQAVTSDLLILRTPWRGGRFVLEEASVEIADGVKAAYNGRKEDPGAYRSLMATMQGGEEGFLLSLLESVREVPVDFPRGWEER